jgi:predicted ester cyclase
MPTPAGEAAALLRRIYDEGHNGGDESIYDECYLPGFVHHSKTIHDVAPGAAGEKESMRRFRAAVPDVHFDVVDVLAQGDLAAVRLTITGHPRAAFGSIEAGGRLDIHAVALFRLESGRVAEEWFFVDAAR